MKYNLWVFKRLTKQTLLPLSKLWCDFNKRSFTYSLGLKNSYLPHASQLPIPKNKPACRIVDLLDYEHYHHPSAVSTVITAYDQVTKQQKKIKVTLGFVCAIAVN